MPSKSKGRQPDCGSASRPLKRRSVFGGDPTEKKRRSKLERRARREPNRFVQIADKAFGPSSRGEQLLQELSPEGANCAFRLIQEALTNVAKHAQATSADVER
jgi:signal transduction histidine kinase